MPARLTQILCLAALLLALAAGLFAQTDPVLTPQKPLKVGCVDLDRVMDEAASIRRMVNSVQENIKSEQETISEKLTRYKVLSETFEQQKSILTEEQRKTRRDEIDELKIAIEEQQDRINRMIRRSEREVVEPTLKLVENAISALGKEEGFDLILRADTVLFASERCDITTQVIARIDSDDKASAQPTSEPEISEDETVEEEPEPTPVATPTPVPTKEDSAITY